jgi:hypothetical protein
VLAALNPLVIFGWLVHSYFLLPDVCHFQNVCTMFAPKTVGHHVAGP